MIKTKYGEQEESLKIERKKPKPQRVSQINLKIKGN